MATGSAILKARGADILVDADLLQALQKSHWRLLRSGTSRGHLYAVRNIRKSDGRRTVEFLHRFVACAGPEQIVDHANGDTFDCRRSNLRICTPRENATNVTRSKNQKKGGYKGVAWNRNASKWEAYISAGEIRNNGKRKRIYLGLFKDPTDAARAYDAAAVVHFGEFAALNFSANGSARRSA